MKSQGWETRLAVCNATRGRSSGGSVDAVIADANLTDVDAAGGELEFVNIHYYAAAAIRCGGVAMSGYQYEGKSYDAKFAHVEDLDTCISCHDPHSLEIKIDTIREALYAAIQQYAASVAGTPIVYDSHAYPYFFVDTDSNGQIDAGEASYSNRYRSFTPRLLKAAYNYQYSLKDTGAFVHNGKYVIQILSDSLEDIASK